MIDKNSTKAEVLEAVRILGGEVLYRASDELRADREFVLEVVRKCGFALGQVSEELKGDREVVLTAVRQNWEALQYASDELRNDKDVVMAALMNGPRAVAYAGDELQKVFFGNREFVLEQVKKYGLGLECVSDDLKGDREVVLAALGRRSYSLSCIGESLHNDIDVLIWIIRREGTFAQKVATALFCFFTGRNGSFREQKMINIDKNSTKEEVLETVKQEGRALRYASNNLKDDQDVVLTAVEQCWEAIEYASNRLKREIIQSWIERAGQLTKDD